MSVPIWRERCGQFPSVVRLLDMSDCEYEEFVPESVDQIPRATCSPHICNLEPNMSRGIAVFSKQLNNTKIAISDSQRMNKIQVNGQDG